MTLAELMVKLESMTQEDLAGTIFWMAGYMSEQGKETFGEFCECVQTSPYFPE